MRTSPAEKAAVFQEQRNLETQISGGLSFFKCHSLLLDLLWVLGKPACADDVLSLNVTAPVGFLSTQALPDLVC